jgi:hypothetical protein
MLNTTTVVELRALVSRAFDEARGNVVTAEVTETYVRLTVHSIRGVTVATLAAVRGYPFLFMANDGIRKDPSWPTLELIGSIVQEAHEASSEKKEVAA